MPARTRSGEIWMVDLGLVAKVRPCPVLSNYPADDELALFTIVPHTTAARGNRWEFPSLCHSCAAGSFTSSKSSRSPSPDWSGS